MFFKVLAILFHLQAPSYGLTLRTDIGSPPRVLRVSVATPQRPPASHWEINEQGGSSVIIFC